LTRGHLSGCSHIGRLGPRNQEHGTSCLEAENQGNDTRIKGSCERVKGDRDPWYPKPSKKTGGVHTEGRQASASAGFCSRKWGYADALPRIGNIPDGKLQLST